MKILIINGPNINLIEQRNSLHYGKLSYKKLCKEIKKHAKLKNIKIKIKQTNSESKIIKHIQKVIINKKFNYIIVNLGAFAHYSYTIRDCIEIIKDKVVSVHLSKVFDREDFRKKDVLSDLNIKMFYGKKLHSYFEAINYCKEKGEI